MKRCICRGFVRDFQQLLQILKASEYNASAAERPPIIANLEGIAEWITHVRDTIVETEPNIQKVEDLEVQLDEIQVS